MNGHVVEQLSAFLDGELDERERAAVARHLEACLACAGHLDDLVAVDRLAASMTVEAPAGYFDAFASRVRDRIRKPARRPVAAPAWALSAAAVLLLAVTVPILLRRQLAPSREAPAAVAVAPPQTAPPAASVAPPEVFDRLRSSADVADGKREKLHAEMQPGRATESAPAKKPASRQQHKDEAFTTIPPQAARPAPPPPAAPAVTAPEALPQARADAEPEADSATRMAGLEERKERLERTWEQNQAASGFAAAPESVAVESAEAPKAALQKTAPTAPSAAFRALLERKAETIAEARGLREAWRAFVQGAPDAEADEARVRVIESGREAYRLSGERADLDLVRRDAAAYLKRGDAHQADRVRALLRGLPR